MQFEQEIRQDLARKSAELDALHHALGREVRSGAVTEAELMRALDAVRAAVRDCRVCQENHFAGLIPLAHDTLGETIVLLNGADAVLGDVIAALLPRASPTD